MYNVVPRVKEEKRTKEEEESRVLSSIVRLPLLLTTAMDGSQVEQRQGGMEQVGKVMEGNKMFNWFTTCSQVFLVGEEGKRDVWSVFQSPSIHPSVHPARDSQVMQHPTTRTTERKPHSPPIANCRLP